MFFSDEPEATFAPFGDMDFRLEGAAVNSTPEPGSLALHGIGLAAACRRKAA